MEQPVELVENAYAAYPHCNGFLDRNTAVVVARAPKPALVEVDLVTGEHKRHVQIADDPAAMVDFDVARDARRATYVRNNTAFVTELDGSNIARPVHTPAAGAYIEGCSLNGDGDRLLLMEVRPESWAAVTVDVASGRPITLFAKPWRMAHIQYCPFDENWIGFCHEGLTTTIADRVWAWHSTLAPHGRCVFDQHAAANLRTREPAKDASAEQIDFLCVGHERWAFHANAFVVCAYGDSPMGPRGLYLGYADSRPARLICESDRFWHCDISPDGQWAVVDTIGPSDHPGRGWTDSRNTSDVLLINVESGKKTLIERTYLPDAPRHPHHPHPIFSPDGSYVLYNRTAPGTDRVSVAVWKCPQAVSVIPRPSEYMTQSRHAVG